MKTKNLNGKYLQIELMHKLVYWNYCLSKRVRSGIRCLNSANQIIIITTAKHLSSLKPIFQITLHLAPYFSFENKTLTTGIRGWATVLTATCTRVITKRWSIAHGTVAMSSAVANTISIAILWTYPTTSLLSQGANCHALLIHTHLKSLLLKLYLFTYKVIHALLVC